MQPEEDAQLPAPEEASDVAHRGAARRRQVPRALKAGCIIIFLTMCSCLGTLVIALQGGPVSIALPFGNTLRIGSDDFVLKDYSFRDGTTYFIDWSGNGARNIVEFRLTDEDRGLDVVVHHADPSSQGDTRLLTLTLP